MRGTGLFTVGFLSGYLLLMMVTALSRSLWLRVYGPFLPFALGLWAAVPYLLQSLGLVSPLDAGQAVWNVFFFYPLLSAADTAAYWPIRVESQVALATAGYLHLLWRYVRLVQRTASDHAE